MSLTVIVLVVVGAIVLAAAAIYLARGGANRRSERLNPARAGGTRAAAEAREGESTPIPGALDPMTLGRLRSGREGDRLSEDDIARQKMGTRGRPGQPPPAPNLKESETQLPKPLDPGHTALISAFVASRPKQPLAIACRARFATSADEISRRRGFLNVTVSRRRGRTVAIDFTDKLIRHIEWSGPWLLSLMLAFPSVRSILAKLTSIEVRATARRSSLLQPYARMLRHGGAEAKRHIRCRADAQCDAPLREQRDQIAVPDRAHPMIDTRAPSKSMAT